MAKEPVEVSYTDVFLHHLALTLAKSGVVKGTNLDKVYIDEEGNTICQTPFMTLYAQSPWRNIGAVGINMKAMQTITSIADPMPMVDKKSKKLVFSGRSAQTDVPTSFSFVPLGVPIPCDEPKRSGNKFKLNIDSTVLITCLAILHPFLNKQKSHSDYSGVTIEGSSLWTYNLVTHCSVKVDEPICKETITLPPYLCEYLIDAKEKFDAVVYDNNIRIIFESGVVLWCSLVIEHQPSDKKFGVSEEPDLTLRVEETDQFKKEIARVKKFSNVSHIGMSVNDQFLKLHSEDARIGFIEDMFTMDVVWSDSHPDKKYEATVAADDFLSAFGVVDRFKIYVVKQRMRGFSKITCEDEQKTPVKVIIWMPIRLAEQ